MITRPKYKIERIQLIVIICVWIFIFSTPILFGEFSFRNRMELIIKILIEYGIVLLIFLFNRFILLPYLFFRAKRFLYFLSIIGVIGLFGTVIYIGDDKKRPPPPMPMQRPDDFLFHEHPFPLPPPHHERPREFIPPYANLFIFTILAVGFDTGLIFATKWVKSEQNKLELERENIENKMAFLQNQISPHFFMNTLNNIHALADIDIDETKESIIMLSEMMSYMLYESQTEKVLIQKEIDFVKSYVELMKLRFIEEVNITLNIPDEIPEVSIPPLLTISLIENAFKHGISYESPSFIHISYSVAKGRFYFEIENTDHGKQEKKSNSGIGIQNTRNRLDLIYKDDYELKISSLPTLFNVKLNVPYD